MANQKTLAKNFAANAFSTTVLQSNLLAMLVHSGAWKVIRARQLPNLPDAVCSSPGRGPRAPSPSSPAMDEARGSSGSAAGRGATQPGDRSPDRPACGEAAESDGNAAGTLRKRKRGRPGRGTTGLGQHRGWNRKGKVLSIATKVEYLRAWKQLAQDSKCKCPTKEMLHRKAQYLGIFHFCFVKRSDFQSIWLRGLKLIFPSVGGEDQIFKVFECKPFGHQSCI